MIETLRQKRMLYVVEANRMTPRDTAKHNSSGSQTPAVESTRYEPTAWGGEII